MSNLMIDASNNSVISENSFCKIINGHNCSDSSSSVSSTEYKELYDKNEILDEKINECFLNTKFNKFEDNENIIIEEKNKIIQKKRKRYNKLYICNCGSIYKSKENMILHYKNIHQNIKPYHCSYCEGTFAHRTGKLYHERRFHTFIYPYSCPHSTSNLYLYYI